MCADGGDVTLLLRAMKNGDEHAAEQLLPLVYKELHRLAKAYMRRERSDHTLQPTALINEAYLRLARENIDWQSRQHFIGFAANVMRHLLVDHARGSRSNGRRSTARTRSISATNGSTWPLKMQGQVKVN